MKRLKLIEAYISDTSVKTARSAKYSESSTEGDSFLLTHPEIQEFILKRIKP